MLCGVLFASDADYKQTEDFKNKNPGDIVSFTATSPGTVLTGKVTNLGGFTWTGNKASWAGKISESFTGKHNGLISGAYEATGEALRRQLSARGFSHLLTFYAHFIGVLAHEREHANFHIPKGAPGDPDKD